MLAIAFLCLLSVFSQSACSTQNPQITQCSGVTKPVVLIESVTITGAELGQTIKMEAAVTVTTEVGNKPVLQISLSTPGGLTIPCVPAVLPCSLKLCDGKTQVEKTLNKDWGNTCPVQEGHYTALLTFPLPGSLLAQTNFGNGQIVVKAKIVDGDDVYECVTFPLQIGIN